MTESGAARESDPHTSHDAAASISPESLYAVVLDALREARTGLISHEIAHRAGISWGTITPRMKPLREKKLVYDTGLGRSWYGSPGNPPSDRMSIVWQLEALRDVAIPLVGGTVVREPRGKPRKERNEQTQ